MKRKPRTDGSAGDVSGLPPGEPSQRTVTSVLVVLDDPISLDRICRYLERKGDMTVDISVSVEDALHLMQYVSFDVIVTDYACWIPDPNGLLRAVRDRGRATPFVYFSVSRDERVEEEARQYGHIRFLTRDGNPAANVFDPLYRSIRQAGGRKRGGQAPS